MTNALSPARLAILLTLFLLPAAAGGVADDLEERGVVAIEQALLDIQTIGRVMNLAAHPDDEDGGTLAYCRHGLGLRTFSIFGNRGEGGQNEIGPELYRELGAIREIETRRACVRLGTKPYFLGLEDYGYGKRAEEAFEKWGGKRHVVERVVFAIRNCRPDVIFTNHDPVTGHGQHRALAIAAREAFDLAGDPSAFPEHFEQGVRPWEPTLYLERTNAPGHDLEKAEEAGAEQLVKLQVDGIDRIRGTSYVEQAHLALKQHASQGRWLRSGPTARIFKVVGRRHQPFLPPKENPFDPINLNRLRIFRAIAEGSISNETQTTLLDPNTLRLRPPRDRDGLARALFEYRSVLRGLLNREDGHPLCNELIEDLSELDRLIDRTIGMVLAVRHEFEIDPDPPVAGGYSMDRARHLGEGVEAGSGDDLNSYAPDAPSVETFHIPLWASPEYDAFDPNRWVTSWSVSLRYTPTGKEFRVEDPRSVAFRPPVAVQFAPRLRVLLASDKTLDVQALAMIDVAEALESDTEVQLVAADSSDAPLWQGTLPTTVAGSHMVPIRFEVPGSPGRLPTLFLQGGVEQGVHALTNLNVTVVDAKLAGKPRVGIVRSYDDTLENALADLGVDGRRLSSDDLAFRDLSEFDAILVDIRAYLVRDDLRLFNDRLLEYARAGGVVAVFYQKTFEWNPKEKGGRTFAPFELTLTRSRVVDENAAVTILQPDHPLLSFPNQIGPDDFNRWVHERGLYFPEKSYGPEYAELLSCHDEGEDPLPGGLLVARCGKGWYVYTAYGWYRQWLAGVPGAYRFLANLVSLHEADSN